MRIIRRKLVRVLIKSKIINAPIPSFFLRVYICSHNDWICDWLSRSDFFLRRSDGTRKERKTTVFTELTNSCLFSRTGWICVWSFFFARSVKKIKKIVILNHHAVGSIHRSRRMLAEREIIALVTRLIRKYHKFVHSSDQVLIML